MEIYNETMYDLLSTLSSSVKDTPSSTYQTNSLQVIEDDQGIYVRGLSRHLAQNEEDALNMLFEVPDISIKSRSRNTMVMSDFRPEVEIRPFRACAMKNMQYNAYL